MIKALKTSPVLAVKDACAYIGISRSKLYRMMKFEGLPFIKLGGAIRIYEKDIISFLDRNKVTVSNPHQMASSKS